MITTGADALAFIEETITQMRTPEKVEKDAVKAFLKERRVQSLTAPLDDAVGFYWMPVPGGYGTSLLDFVICYRSEFIAVETKRLGDAPTPRQKIIIDMIEAGKGLVVWGTAAEIIDALTQAFDCLDDLARRTVYSDNDYA